MNYQFENLGDERFQEFCHCIIEKEFQNTQAFPVGQPDGGRDSLAYLMNSVKKEFIVFQVKFIRDPYRILDIHKWLVGIIEKEVKKINKLIPKGAVAYYLITNVKGTSHLDSGSIDRLNSLFEHNICIPSICWWADDLSRKLDSNPILKWSYPELINGQDLFNSIVFNSLNEHRERRETVIKAYLADQYEIDNEVKFKQIELQNRLFDLFIDVPIRIKKYDESNKRIKRFLSNIFSYNEAKYMNADLLMYEGETNIGAATFLLNPKVHKHLERVLIEGGPGQGKSTISQYVCQIHRIRLLNKQDDLDLLQDELKRSPLKLPFKIDLRDLAAWVEEKNPYAGSLSDDYFDKNWSKSLESFLIAHICYHSKLDCFSSSDLIAICKLSSILFVFDGFDEIANFKIREEIIELINRGVNRLKEYSKSIQVLITSRPAAFSNTINFAIESYPHFELTDITLSLIEEYVEKWIVTRKLRHREANEIRRLVKEKLQMPHLRDLAKNPMQLAIFISLLNTRGESLPNKRTALYDSYIELFFNRESEKNVIIRDKRDLIIDIHQYLAWILHSEAELYKSNGRIDIGNLKKRLIEYLIKEGHTTDIIDKLFTVIEERVCALVSRVQGTFEFEVQPLREYFCAKYLYKTSPYSPAGFEKCGTKPDRFDALSRNYYWQNVLRFFAGCFDRGELPMLIQKLQELQDDRLLRYTNYPRLITSQLLSDWVFTQYPRLLEKVVKIIIDGLDIGAILSQHFMIHNYEPIVLPEECGRNELESACFNELKEFPLFDYALELINTINDNPSNIVELWKSQAEELRNEKLTKWLEYGYLLRILHRLDPNFLLQLLNVDSMLDEKRIQILLNGNQVDLIIDHADLKNITFNGILESKIQIFPRRLKHNKLTSFLIFTDPTIFLSILTSDITECSFKDWVYQRFVRYQILDDNKEFSMFSVDSPNDSIDYNMKKYYELIDEVLGYNVNNWKKSIIPWDALVENGRKIFGEKWIFYLISIISAGIKSKDEKYEEFDKLDDSRNSLCKRVRCARMKSGNVTWWRNQIENTANLCFSLLTFFVWATPKTIIQLLPVVSKKMHFLSPYDFEKLISALKRIATVSQLSLTQQKHFINQINSIEVSENIKYILSLRFDDPVRQEYIFENLKNYSGDIQDIVELRLEFLIKKLVEDKCDHSILEEIKSAYSKFEDHHYMYHRYNRYIQNELFTIPYDVSKDIMQDCKAYPRLLVALAEQSCRIYANKYVVPVGKIAEEEGWFFTGEI